MDSLTHIALGAVIGEVTLGKKVGNKAPLYGAIIGTLPDLDVLITPFLDPVPSLFFHRGISHSLFALLLIPPLIGWILYKLERQHLISFKTWVMFAFLPLLSHIFIDCFNTYGTGIFEPFSSVRVAYDSMAIIDFIFLLPLITASIWSILLHKQNKNRRLISWIGLSISSIYFIITLFNKSNVEYYAKQHLANKSIAYNRLLATPVPLSNFMWLIVAENDVEYTLGICNLTKKSEIEFSTYPRNTHLISKFAGKKDMQELLQFTKGFYSAEKDSLDNTWLYDLRYCGLNFEDANSHVFSFKIMQTNTGVEISRAHPKRKINPQTIRNYFVKVF